MIINLASSAQLVMLFAVVAARQKQSDGSQVSFVGSNKGAIQSPTTSGAGPQQIGLGEGLTLNERNQNGEDGGSQRDNAHQWQQQHWPSSMQQLDRIKSDNKVSALVGQNVILNCAVQFKDGLEKPFVVNWLKYPHKLPIYIWYAGYPPHVAQGYENRVSRIGQASLNLTQVKETDQGLYECKIYYLDRRPEDKSNGTWIFLDVQAPPHFSQTPPPVSYVQAGDSLHLTCQAESTPTPILRWYKNKTPIESDNGAFRLSSSLPQIAGHSNSNSNPEAASQQALLGGPGSSQLDLFIDNIQPGSTTGDYLCLASNSEGSAEARSQVVLALPAVITTMPRNQTRLEGENLELLCQAKALPANITYKWLFNDKPIQSLKLFESRHSIRRDGTLVIHSVHRDDQGEYKCQATNGLAHRNRLPISSPGRSIGGQQQQQTITAASKTSPQAQLTTAPIYAEASAQLTVEYPARITYSPPVQYLPLALSGLIRCFVQANPPVEFFTWTLNNQQFDPNVDQNVEVLKNGSLLIRQVSKQYEGKYRCAPFNKHGSAGSSAAMEVRVEEPPYFTLKPDEFYKANLNGQVRIACDGKGLPKPSVYWRKVISTGPSNPIRTRYQAPADLSSQDSTSSSQTTLQASNTDNLANLLVDEVADEPEPDQHLYVTGSSTGNLAQSVSQQTDDNQDQQTGRSIEQAASATIASATPATPDEQLSVISYAKLPSDRSEYKSPHLFLHALRKEDHGRYECVLENEVATLTVSTMLYIEETTPHAPAHLQVETKAWSAHLSWLAGYDGGFEQSFVVWYRQSERSNWTQDEQQQARLTGAVTSQLPYLHQQPTSEHREMIDFNWHSVNVQPSDATVYTVQNLSQDTSYEFYVRAKNIIGDGPRSPIVQARTKRALTGSLAPVRVDLDQTSSTPSEEHNNLPMAAHDDEENSDGMTSKPTVLGIIHLVPITTDSPNSSDSGRSSGSQSSQQQQAPDQMMLSSNNDVDSGSTSLANNSSKMIRIYFPVKQTSSSNSNETHSSLSNTRSHSDQSEQKADETNSTSQAQAVVQDQSLLPHNISMIKVAQGWVLNWWPPKRLAPEPTALERVEAATSNALPASGLLPTLTFSTSDGIQTSSSGNINEPAAYSVEFREKGATWQPLATSRERSLLLNDLKPGTEYMFRVFAHSPGGSRGPPSAEFRYLIPDNRRKPGSTQALSAGVVSGVLFFIACIVIAVCAVNMCNKRRKKRAEKAAYVMMACPVLESHHDIAALNSNSLMKKNKPMLEMNSLLNSHLNLAGRVPSLIGPLERSKQAQAPPANDMKPPFPAGGNFTSNRKGIPDNTSSHLQQQPTQQLSKFFAQGRVAGGISAAKSSSSESSPSMLPRGIKFTANAPLPVDVDADDHKRQQYQPEERTKQIGLDMNDDDAQLDLNSLDSDKNVSQLVSVERKSPIDDYWVRRPSDRKWGTLTLAGSKLAERRAREHAQREQLTTNSCITSPGSQEPAEKTDQAAQTEVDSLADECYMSSVVQQPNAGSRTLPRLWRASGNGAQIKTRTTGDHLVGQQQQSIRLTQDRSHQQFNSWLDKQLIWQEAANALQQPPTVPPRYTTNRLPSTASSSIVRPVNGGQLHQRSRSQVEPPTNYLLLSQQHQNYLQYNQPCHQQTFFAYNMAQQKPAWIPAPGYSLNQRHQPLGSNNNSFLDAQTNNVLPFACAHPTSERTSQHWSSFLQQVRGPPLTGSGGSNIVANENCDSLSGLNGGQLSGAQLTDANDTVPSMFIGKRNSLARSTLPMVNLAQAAYLSQQSAGQWSHFTPNQSICPFYPLFNLQQTNKNNQNDDDPLTDNACLGSHKRKRRLPHIEAQFTITQPEVSPIGRDGINMSDEQEAIENGHLFVRSIAPGGCKIPEQTMNKPMEARPRGLPQPGQRSEQRRLRPMAQVEAIDTREKIETYLRHYESVQKLQQLTPPGSTLSVEVEDLEELTFQPYHNLPSLKYTINLPLRRARDGTLLLNETSHLRRSKRNAKGESSTIDQNILRQLNAKKTTHEVNLEKFPATAKRLGSSSSCPAPSNEFKLSLANDDSSFDREHSSQSPEQFNKTRYHSLESGVSQPTAGHPDCLPAELNRGLVPFDSLEFQQATREAASIVSDYEGFDRGISDKSSRRIIPQPPMPETLYQANSNPINLTSSSCSRRSRNQSPPPPPIPPHRTRPQRQIDDDTNVAKLSEIASISGCDSSPERKHSGRTRKSSPIAVSRSASHGVNQVTVDGRDRQILATTSSSSSSSSDSSTVSSAATTTENGGAPSESLTNDHSVDENYEFDLVSSCSSSARPHLSRVNRCGRRQIIKRHTEQSESKAIPPAGSQIPSSHNEQLINENGQGTDLDGLYTHVNKRRPKKKRNRSNSVTGLSLNILTVDQANCDGSAIVEKTQFYDYSLRKQQLLPIVISSPESNERRTTGGNQASQPNSYYDTVYEDVDNGNRPGVKLVNGIDSRKVVD